jgi:hypothetical protein
MILDNSPVIYDIGFLSAYLDGRLSTDDPRRVAFESDLAVNEALNRQLGQLAKNQANVQALITLMDASPRLPNVTQSVMQRFSSRYAGLASPSKLMVSNSKESTIESQHPKSTCASMTPALLCAWADGELLMTDYDRVKQHLNDCSICRQAVQDLQQTTLTIQQTIHQQQPAQVQSIAHDTTTAWSDKTPHLNLPFSLTTPQVNRLKMVPGHSPFLSGYGGNSRRQSTYGLSPFVSAFRWVVIIIALLGLISWLKPFIT